MIANKPTNADILVIGAGPAGIATAYALEQAGLDYLVVDRAEEIAHTWNSLYPSLTLNTSRFYSHMPDERFPLSYGIFATGKQYHQYLVDYVHKHDFKIRLGIDVKRVTPEGDLWRVETSEGDWHYPVVISATGIFDNPITPHIDGIEHFKGDLIHAHDFKDPAQIADKRVLVVGNGPSGVDISVAAGDVAESVHIAMRSGITLKRRYPLGLPSHAWLMIGTFLPKALCRRLLKFIGKFGYSNQEQSGLWAPKPGEGGVTGYQGPELLEAVKAGKVKPVPGPICFNENSVTFADDQTCEFDIVIMATGYQPVLHQYLDIEMQYNTEPWQPQSSCDWEIGPNGQRGWPLRDTSDHPNGRQILGHPGLYLVGTFYKGKGATYNFNVEAEIAAQQIKTYLAAFKERVPA